MGKRIGRNIAAFGIGGCSGILAVAAFVPAWPVFFLASLALVGYGIGRGGEGE